MNGSATHCESRNGIRPETPGVAISVEAGLLKAFAACALGRAGVASEDAAVVSDCLVDADMRGLASHGVSRLPAYVDALQRGFIQARPAILVRRIAQAAAVIDGDNGLGSLIAVRGMREAIALAGESGIGMVAVRRSSPFGHAGYYASLAAANECLGIVFSNGPATVAPFGGCQAMLGTNPIAVAAPGGDRCGFVLDMGTSTVSRGWLRMRARYDEPIPEGVAIAADGTPARTSREAMTGVLLPFGRHKGSGLAMAVDLITGVLSGAGFGTGVRSMYAQGEDHSNVGNAMIAIRISAFLDIAEYYNRYRVWYDELKASQPAAGSHEVMIPGERSTAIAAEQRERGVKLDRDTCQSLRRLAAELGIPF